MKKSISLFTVVLFACFSFAQEIDLNVAQSGYNLQLQEKLNQNENWQNFIQTHGSWQVLFNEYTETPATAYGKPALIPGSTLKEKAMNFFANEGAALNIPADQLELISERSSEKYQYIDFRQYHDGAEVVFSRVKVRFTKDGGMVSINSIVYPELKMEEAPQLSAEAAKSYAAAGLSTAKTNNAVANPEIKILPVFNEKKQAYTYHWVYEVYMPAGVNRFYTLVDATEGEVLYRKNLVERFAPPTETAITVTGTVYPTNPLDPLEERPLGYMKAIVNGAVVYSDVNGTFYFDISGPTEVTFLLEGLWNKTVKGIEGDYDSPSAQMVVTISEGMNETISFTDSSDLPARNIYYHTNNVHDLVKTYLPTFDELDFPILSKYNIVTADGGKGTCNAFWTGAAQNYYEPCTGSGCRYVYTRDVIYHEYAHGISNQFYGLYGQNFSNGSWGEGHSDIWALVLTDDPVLGRGGTCGGNGSVRCYDFAGNNPNTTKCGRKTYPEYGESQMWEIHAVGEIIAGAWWDVRLALGMDKMEELFLEHLSGLPNGPESPDGSSEGRLFFDGLIDALYADDTDGDLTNGTPNKETLVCAWDYHGIAFVNNVSINHPEFESADVADGVVNVDVAVNPVIAPYLTDVSVFYRRNNSGGFDQEVLTKKGEAYYSAFLTIGSLGDSVQYYFQYNTSCGDSSNIYPRRMPYDNTEFFQFKADTVFVGIDDLPVAAKVSVYPNPSQGKFAISVGDQAGAEDMEVTVYNMVGQVVHRQMLAAADKDTEMNLSELRGGLYYLNISTPEGEKIHSEKITLLK